MKRQHKKASPFHILAILLIFLVSLNTRATPATVEDRPLVEFYFFYSEECEHCRMVEDFVLPPLMEEYNIRIHYREVRKPENMELLLRIEKALDAPEAEIPTIVIGRALLSGEEEIAEKLPLLVGEAARRGGVSLFVPKMPTSSTPQREGKPVHLAYFYQKGCLHCDRVLHELNYFREKYPWLRVDQFDIGDDESKLINEALCERSGVPERQRLTAPAVFVGTDHLVGKEITARKIEAIILKYRETGADPAWRKGLARERAAKSILERFKSFTVPAVMLAGLIDGVNPCAFATIVFLISTLSLLGRKGRDIIIIGTTYTIAVYLTYFLIGLGLMESIRRLSFLSGIIRYAFFAVAAGTAVLGVLSIYDYWLIRTGRGMETKLQLPDGLKIRVRRLIKERMKTSGIAAAAATLGFMVSLLELFCTGQVYLPTILFVSKLSELKYTAYAYLAFYNLSFIAPLVVVFYLAYRGATSERILGYFRRHVGLVKLCTAGVFFILSGVLFVVAPE